MEEQKKPLKRGRKVKTVNFESKPEELDDLKIEEPSVLKIPVDIKSLMENCDYSENLADTETNGACSNVVPINSRPLEGNSSNSGIEYKNILTRGYDDNNKNETILTLREPGENVKEYRETCKKTGDTVYVKVSDNKALRETVCGKILAEKTNVVCWWCCHPFDDYPVCAPEKYDGLTDIFKVKGCFCSFNCSKAFMKNERNPSIYLCNSYTKKLLGYIPDITPAPSRYVLKMFGGPLSIEEYRSTFTGLNTVSFNVYPMIYFPTQMEFKSARPTGSSITKSQQRQSVNKCIDGGFTQKENEDSSTNKTPESFKKTRVITKQNIEVSTSRVKKNIEKINKQPKKSLLSLMSIKVVEN
jgi:hypothetical protein